MRPPRSLAIGCAILAGMLPSLGARSAGETEVGPARPAADVAIERVEAIASIGGGDPAEAIALARVALDRAGAEAIEPLASKLDAALNSAMSDGAAAAAAQVFAWALGESASRLPADARGSKLRARALTSLRRALWFTHWPTRLSAASAFLTISE